MRDQIRASVAAKLADALEADGISPALVALLNFLTGERHEGVAIIDLAQDEHENIVMKTSREPNEWTPLAGRIWVIHDMLLLADENDLTPRERAYLLQKLDEDGLRKNYGEIQPRPRAPKDSGPHPEGKPLRVTVVKNVPKPRIEYYPESEKEGLIEWCKNTGNQLHKFSRNQWQKII